MVKIEFCEHDLSNPVYFCHWPFEGMIAGLFPGQGQRISSMVKPKQYCTIPWWAVPTTSCLSKYCQCKSAWYEHLFTLALFSAFLHWYCHCRCWTYEVMLSIFYHWGVLANLCRNLVHLKMMVSTEDLNLSDATNLHGTDKDLNHFSFASECQNKSHFDCVVVFPVSNA